MSFANNDPNWTSAADFVAASATPLEAILAPDLFWRRFPRMFRYVNTRLDPDQNYDWVIAHKGELEHLDRSFLRGLGEAYRPVFANAVFVVLTRDAERAAACDPQSNDVKALWINLAQALEAPQGRPEDEPDVVLPDRGVIEVMSTLGEDEFREAMNSFWRAGGYVYDTLRDQAYYREIDDYISEYVGDAEGLAVLDLCCGTGRLKALLPGAAAIMGVDVSDVAIDMARLRHDGRERFAFEVMDAHRLGFEADSFDLVLFVDAIEHVMRVDEVLDEAVRVLRPGGRLFVTAASRDSLHELMNRKLGFGEFETNYQHIREFGLEEMRQMLGARGLTEVRADGIFLYPYWGIPGVDPVVRELTDNDPETVETFRVLGRRAGPEFAYAFVMLLEKAAA